MDKITQALAKLLPEDQVKEVSEAVSAMLDEAKADLEAEFNDKLNEAYAELHETVKEKEGVAEEGYQQAYAVINELRNRLETQRAEFDAALEEGYEEAYQMLQQEKGKNDIVESDLYEEYNKLAEMKEYIVDKVDQFLQYKGQEIYEQARRDVSNDPRMVEHKLTLDRVIDTVSDYISDEDFALATTSKLDEASKHLEELKGQMRILEARNIRLSTDNNKLNEAVRQQQDLLTEATNSKKERAKKAENVQGRGQTVITEGEKIIREHQEGTEARKEEKKSTLTEGIDPEFLKQQRKLAGLTVDEE